MPRCAAPCCAAERARSAADAEAEAAAAAGIEYKRKRGRPTGSRTKGARGEELPPAETPQEVGIRFIPSGRYINCPVGSVDVNVL